MPSKSIEISLVRERMRILIFVTEDQKTNTYFENTSYLKLHAKFEFYNVRVLFFPKNW